jgi:hypothetical protein
VEYLLFIAWAIFDVRASERRAALHCSPALVWSAYLTPAPGGPVVQYYMAATRSATDGNGATGFNARHTATVPLQGTVLYHATTEGAGARRCLARPPPIRRCFARTDRCEALSCTTYSGFVRGVSSSRAGRVGAPAGLWSSSPHPGGRRLPFFLFRFRRLADPLCRRRS